MNAPIATRPAASPRDSRAAVLPGRRGFSLAELATVLTIVAVLAAVALPRYSNSLAHYKADAAARQLIADLQRAQTAARTTSASVTVTFDASTNAYRVQGTTISLAGGGSDTRRLSKEITGGTIASASFAGGPTLTFDGFGHGSADGSVVLHFGDHVRTITYSTLSDRASFTRSLRSGAAASESAKSEGGK